MHLCAAPMPCSASVHSTDALQRTCAQYRLLIFRLTTLLRVLQQKYGTHRRHLISGQDLGKQYIAVLNSNYLDSFILVAAEKNATYADIRLVYKDISALTTAEPTSSSVSASGAVAETRLYKSKN